MNGLMLRFEDDEEVILPSALLDTDLTMAEIGCIFLLFALGSDSEACHARLLSPEVISSIKSLRDRGILILHIEGTTIKVDLDLTKVEPLAPTKMQPGGEV